MAGDQQSRDDGVAIVAQDYRAEPGTPLPALRQPHAEAFAAGQQKPGGPPLFALVCDRRLAPRFDVISALSRMRRMPLVTPVTWDIVPWEPAQGRRCIILYERPEGERVQAAADAEFTPFSEDAVLQKVILPLLPLLRELNERGLTHRAIRADNLFFKTRDKREILLGECVSAPAGLDQPAVYESVDAALASPGGRGEGHFDDDLYAFGVLLTVLLSGGNPCEGQSDDEIVQSKIARGSYATLVEHLHIALPMIEVLRGLLCDDPRERWSLEELEQWAQGRHLSPKQPVLPAKGSRSYPFDGGEFWSSRALSAALGRNWSAAERVLADDGLVNWVQRSIGDEAQAKRVASALRLRDIEGDGASNTSRNHRCLARMLMALDPAAPLRYRSFAARLDAIPQLLAVEFDGPSVQQLFAQLIGLQLPQSWLDAQANSRPDQLLVLQTFDTIASYLSRRQPGYGMERCLYQYNSYWPCLSPLLENDYVVSINDLLPALERIAPDMDPQREPVDLHIAAFIAARLPELPERALNLLAGRENPLTRAIANVLLLGEVQSRIGPKSLPALCGWISHSLRPAIEAYHNRKMREALEESLAEAVRQGDLRRLGQIANNAELRRRDEQGFARACAEFGNLDREIEWLENGGLVEKDVVTAKSLQVSAVVAGSLSGMSLLVMALTYFT